MPRKNKLEDLSLHEKVFILGLAFTIMKRESENKDIPYRFRRKLAKDVKRLKRIDVERASLEEIKALVTMILSLHIAGHNNLDSIDTLMTLIAPPTDSLKNFYAECKKQAEKTIKGLGDKNGVD